MPNWRFYVPAKNNGRRTKVVQVDPTEGLVGVIVGHGVDQQKIYNSGGKKHNEAESKDFWSQHFNSFESIKKPCLAVGLATIVVAMIIMLVELVSNSNVTQDEENIIHNILNLDGFENAFRDLNITRRATFAPTQYRPPTPQPASLVNPSFSWGNTDGWTATPGTSMRFKLVPDVLEERDCMCLDSDGSTLPNAFQTFLTTKGQEYEVRYKVQVLNGGPGNPIDPGCSNVPGAQYCSGMLVLHAGTFQNNDGFFQLYADTSTRNWQTVTGIFTAPANRVSVAVRQHSKEVCYDEISITILPGLGCLALDDEQQCSECSDPSKHMAWGNRCICKDWYEDVSDSSRLNCKLISTLPPSTAQPTAPTVPRTKSPTTLKPTKLQATSRPTFAPAPTYSPSPFPTEPPTYTPTLQPTNDGDTSNPSNNPTTLPTVAPSV